MLLGDIRPLGPPLHGGVVLMLKGSGKRSDAAKVVDDVGMGFHNPQYVRCVRTSVNSPRTDCDVESEQGAAAICGVAKDPTIGDKLLRLKTRSGLSLDRIAKAGGYKRRSSVQRYFESNYNPDFLPLDVARKLADALTGKGSPQIERDEILTLAGVSDTNVRGTFAVNEPGGVGAMPRDIPIYGTALGGELRTEDLGNKPVNVEQSVLDQSEIIGYLRRPLALQDRKDLYGVYVSGSSMYPRFADGEAALVDPKRPPMIGDDVVIQMVDSDGSDGERVTLVLIKRLLRRSASFIELEQFNPPISFRINAKQVRAVHRIVPAAELFS
jgi:hypothetical protein